MPAFFCANADRTEAIYFGRPLGSGPPIDTPLEVEQLFLHAGRHQRCQLVVRSWYNNSHYTHDIGINTTKYFTPITTYFLLLAHTLRHHDAQGV